MKQTPYRLLLNYAFRILSRKAYTEAEILDRLARRALKVKLADSETAIKKVLERLRELHYIDDSRILSDFFEYRLKNRPIGKFRFLHEMHRRGIPFEEASGQWERRNIEEEPIARQFLKSRQRLWQGLPPVLRKQKMARMLASRGFSPDTVWKIVSG